MAQPLRILSIDGGGIRGIIPATVLAELERRTGKPVAESFDLIAGTSTGGILALALSMPGEAGRPAWSADELIGLYEREGPEIFSRSLWQRITSAEGVLDEKYSPDGLERAFDRYFRDARLKDALTDVLVTAYDLEQRRTFFFKSAKARQNPKDDYAMRDAALATSAAPTYFEPVKLRNGGEGGYLALVDGGVFATNPAMCAYAEALKVESVGGVDSAGPGVILVSLGTGQQIRRIPYDKAKDWGIAHWARPILDVVFDGVSDATDHQLDQLLGRDRHYRFQTRLDKASDDLDNASDRNLELLKQEARELIREHEERLAEMVEKLRGP